LPTARRHKPKPKHTYPPVSFSILCKYHVHLHGQFYLLYFMNKVSIFFILIVFLFSCKQDTLVVTSEFYQDYIVLNNSDIYIYDLDSVIFRDKQKRDTIRYQIRMELCNMESTGDVSEPFIIKVFKKNIDDDHWNEFQNNRAYLHDNSYIIQQDNQAVIHLKFPVKPGYYWNRNMYNSQKPAYSLYENVHSAFHWGPLQFDTSIHVNEISDTFNLIFNRLQYKVYAWNLGLIYAYSDSLELDFHPDRKGDTINGYISRLLFNNYISSQ
jgi:hypothetical protein